MWNCHKTSVTWEWALMHPHAHSSFLSVPFEPNNPPCSFSNTCHLPSPQVYIGSLNIAGKPSPRYWGYPWEKTHPWKFK